MLKLYGIKNCDTVRRARKWLDQNDYDYSFHDFRKDGLDADLVERLSAEIGWEKMLNRRSTSWRQLADADREKLDESRAVQLMLKHPTLIKRPVIEHDSRFTVGFSPDFFQGPS
jgi:arsenate reductase